MTSDSSDTTWFVLKDNRRLGPFGYFEVIRMIQENKVHSFDFIRRSSDKTWSQVADVSEFQQHSIKSLDDPDIKFDTPLYSRRRYERHELNSRVFLNHQNLSLWANAIEIGQGGMGIDTVYALLDVGHSFQIHLKYDQSLNLNALVKVVSKRSWKNPLDNTFSFRYGLKFIKLDPKSKISLNQILDTFKPNKEVA